jgi:exonuclease III
MSCLSWNCSGLGHAATVKELREFAKQFAPTVLCVLETQAHKARVGGLKHSLDYDNTFVVSSSGRNGGLGIFWNNNTRVEILLYSRYHIDSIITVWVRGDSHVSMVRHKLASDTRLGIC